MNQKELHDKVLYPVTRVKAGKAGGSGVLVYSEPDPKNDGKYINIVLTCQHVIDGSISVKDEWDSLLKREIKKVNYIGNQKRYRIRPFQNGNFGGSFKRYF